MFYKVMKNGKVIDVLDRLIFVKYDPKYKRMVLCGRQYAQGILSSDTSKIWHEENLYQIPVDGYDTVTVVEVDKYEYEKLRMLNGKTAEEIIDAYTLSLIEEGVI